MHCKSPATLFTLNGWRNDMVEGGVRNRALNIAKNNHIFVDYFEMGQ